MLARSFAEFHAQRSVGDRRGELAIDNAALRKVESLIETESRISPDEWSKALRWDEHSRAIASSLEYVRESIMSSRGAQNALSPGRVLLIAAEGEGGENSEGLPRGGVSKYCALLRTITSTSGKCFVVLAPCPEGHAETATQPDEEQSNEPQPLRKKDDDDDFFGMGKKVPKRGANTDVSNVMPDGLPWFKQAGGVDFIVACIPDTAVLAITTSRVNVEADEILNSGAAPGATSRALLAMEKLSAETTYEALHPLKDLKLQDIATVEACQHHAELVKTLPPMPVASAQKLREWSALLRARHILKLRGRNIGKGLLDFDFPTFEDVKAGATGP